ncbi:zinc ribbon domain-containing protein, partial [Nostoc sp.]
IKGQIRLIHRLGKWEIHYTTDIKSALKRDTGLNIGVDRGYAEVYATSSNDDARFIGTDFGKLQTTESDYRKEKGVKRNKIRSIAEKAIKKGNSAKADRIKRNNLGRIKWNSRESSFKGRIKTLVFTATLQLMHDGIRSVAYEDLTEQFSSKARRSKRTKRNLSSWLKGVVSDALIQVSSRVGCTIISVNPCYTSQLDSRHGVLLGIREGDKFTCFDGVVLQSDINAADNVLARSSDDEITRFTKYKIAKEILLERTRKFQEQLNQVLEVTQEVWNSVFDAVTGTDKPQTLEPKRQPTSKVNQRANYEQLTLFDFG